MEMWMDFGALVFISGAESQSHSCSNAPWEQTSMRPGPGNTPGQLWERPRAGEARGGVVGARGVQVQHGDCLRIEMQRSLNTRATSHMGPVQKKAQDSVTQ
ncbi:uncharacterized [Tachysurus ichikawai]